MIIKVTANDIAKGIRGNASECPVARALHRAGFKKATVGLVTASKDPTKVGSVINLPQEVSRFITSFDGGEVVQPFSFEVPWRKPVAKKVAAKRKKGTARK